jgi:endonuclease/exonuclease/phosphatase family metal-dependent hydrolase
VRVLSLNLWNISEPLDQRMSALIAGIYQLKPDIVCFQEVRLTLCFGGFNPKLSRSIAASRTMYIRSVVICGDLNDQPGSPAVQAILDGEYGRFDVFASSEEPGHTYSSKNPYVDPTLWPDGRIDYIFADGELRAADCGIVFDGRHGLGAVSDHFGLFCRFGFS